MHGKFLRFFVTAVITAVCCVGSAFADVAVNSANFPDNTFRNYVTANFDKDRNRFLSEAEISDAKSVSITGTSMSSLEGIKYLTSLTTLDCQSNALTTLDLSNLTSLQEVYCSYNQLSTLDVTGCTSLQDLRCHDNQLEALDVRGCKALEYMACDSNQLVTVDAGGCTALQELYCQGNQLTTLNVSGCTALHTLYCQANRLTTLNVSGCTALHTLYCQDNQLTTLNVSGCSALYDLYCGNNQLANLDLSSNTELRNLNCMYNCLASLNIDNCGKIYYMVSYGQRVGYLNISDSDNPSYPYQLDFADYMPNDRFTYVTDVKGIYGRKELSADYEDGNQFVGFKPRPDSMTYNFTLYVDGGVETMGVTIYDGRLIPIDAENFPDEAFRAYVTNDWDRDKDGFLSYEERTYTTDMNVDGLGISSLKGIEYFSALTYLSFGNNSVASVDLSSNTNLERLYCYSNQLTSLDVSSLTDLQYLECQNNKLAAIDISTCTALEYVECYGQEIDTLKITNSDNPSYPYQLDLRDYGLSPDQFADISDVHGFYGKKDIQITSSDGIVYFASRPEGLNYNYVLKYNNTTKNMYVEIYDGTPIEINAENFPDEAFRAYVTNDWDWDKDGFLSYEERTYMNDMNVDGLGISSLKGIEYFTALTELNCYSNDLTSFDLSRNTNLGNLNCDKNSLTTIDVSKLTALKRLSCYQNKLTEIDVSKCLSLKDLDCSHNRIRTIDLSKNKELTGVTCDNQEIGGLVLTATGDSEYPYKADLSRYLSPDKLVNVSFVKGQYDSGIDIETSYSNGTAYFKAKPARLLYEYPTGFGNSVMEVTISREVVSIAVNAANFPDDNFRQYVMYYWDNELSEEEIENTTVIDVNGYGISSLKGIEYFTALTRLNCESNDLAALDLANNTRLVNVEGLTQNFNGLRVTATGEAEYSYQFSLSDYMSPDQFGNVSGLKGRDFDGSALQMTSDADGVIKFVSKPVSITYVYDTGLNGLKMEVGIFDSDSVIKINAENFPDENFRNYVKNNLADGDGTISPKGVQEIREIYVQYWYGISDLKGIEHFYALEKLVCYNNNLTELDLSQNTALTYLDCSNNQLTSLNVSQNTALRYLNCSNNRLESLDVSNNTELEYLDCHTNLLTALDVNSNEDLTELYCYDNRLVSFGAVNNVVLERLSCANNLLESLDVSNNPALRMLDCGYNRLASLDVGSNTELVYLNCSSNDLSRIDLSNNTALTKLECDFNRLTSLDVSGCLSLDSLYCNSNLITVLDLSMNTGLTRLDCATNRLTFLELRSNPNLSIADYGSQELDGLTVENVGGTYRLSFWDYMSNDKFVYVSDVKGYDVRGNEIEASFLNGVATFASEPYKVTYNYATGHSSMNKMDVTIARTLRKVPINEENFPDDTFRSYVRENFDWNGDEALNEGEIYIVTSIDVKALGISSLKGIEYFTALVSLDCRENWLISLDVSKNTALTFLNCESNQLTTLNVSKNTALQELHCKSNQLTTLDVSNNLALWRLGCAYNQLTSLDLSKNIALSRLGFSDNQLTEIDLSKNTALTFINCQSNQLKALDVSKNTALQELHCSVNQLKTLDVSKNKALTSLGCAANQLTTLDVSKNTALRDLHFDWNQLTAIDLTQNTALTELDCWNNQLTALDVSHNTALTRIRCYNNMITVLDVRSCPNVEIECDEGMRIIRRDGTKPTITTGTTLLEGKTGQRYSVQLQANGDTPITWTASGNLPSWLNLSSSGLISGTPTTAGNYTFSVTAANEYGSASATFTLSVTDPASKPTITTDTTTLTIPTGTAFSLQLAATGTTPITWTKSGTLPTGLNLSKEGLISGTPKSAQTKTFKVTAKNKQGSDTKSFTITVYVPVSITTAKLADGTTDKNYNATLKAKGSNVVWSATGLPDGLSINPKTGKISGKTSKYGEYSVVVRAENSSTHEEKTFTLTIKGVAPTISGSLKSPELNKAYSSGLKVKGTQPIEWSISGNLPDGLTFDEETGTISGTPTSYLKSGYKITITAKGPGGSKSKTVTLRVKGTAPTITGTLKQAELYKAYSAALKVKGSDTITLSMSGKLPDGLTFNASTGEISGTPKSYEKSGYKFTVTATNPVGSKSKTFTLKVKGTAPTLSGSLKTPELNKAYSSGLKVKGTEPITWSLTGTLPDGLTFDEETGTISGTPTSYSKSGYKITITASNIVGTKSKKITLKVKGTAPSIKTTKLPNATQWSSYSVALNATGSDPITWRAEGLPNGLSLNGNTIEGTPTVSGKKFTVTVYAENPVKEVKKNLSLRIDAAEKPDTVNDTKSPKDTETSPTEPTDKSTPPEVPEQEVPESPHDNEDTSHSEGEYVIVARLGEISRDVEGMYDFDVTLSDDAVVGAELVYIANSSEPSNDDEIAEFFDGTGKEVTEVPDSKHITISIWLRKNVIYNPAVAVRN